MPVRVVGQLPTTSAVPSVVSVAISRAIRPPGLPVRVVGQLPTTSAVPTVISVAVPSAIRPPGLPVRVVGQLTTTSAVPSVVSVAGQRARLSQQRMPVRVVEQVKVTDAVSALVSSAGDGNHHRSTLPGVAAPFRPLGQQHGQQPSTSTAAPSLVPVTDALPQQSGMKIGRQQALTGSAVPSIGSFAEVHAPKNQRGMKTTVVRQQLPTSASASVIAAAGGSVCVVSRTPAKMISVNVQKPSTSTAISEQSFTGVPSQIRPPGKIVDGGNQEPSTSTGTSNIKTERATGSVVINLPENITRKSYQKPSTSSATFSVYEPVLPSSPIMMITDDEHQTAAGAKQTVLSITSTEHSGSCCPLCRMMLMKIDARSAQILVILNEQSTILNPMKGIRRNAQSLAMEKIGNEQQFDAFEAKIAEDDFAFCSYTQRIDADISSQDANNRMHEALDVLFDRNFLARCSWEGSSGKKIAFSKYRNTVRLFKSIATNHVGIEVDIEYVKEYLKRKLTHAPARVNMQGNVKTSCHRRKK